MVNFVIEYKKNGKYYPTEFQVNNLDNIVVSMNKAAKRHNAEIFSMLYMPSFKKAMSTADAWKEAHEQNGDLMSLEELFEMEG